MKKTKLRIHLWGEPILQKKCLPVEEVDFQIRQLLNEMYLLMKVSGGIGLAANQAGIDKQLVVVETAEDGVFKLANPCILKKEGRQISKEGCLSFPGIELDIPRAEKVWVKAWDENGEEIELEAEGILAIVLQHEIDHINGIVFIDRANIFQRIKWSKQLSQIKKQSLATNK